MISKDCVTLEIGVMQFYRETLVVEHFIIYWTLVIDFHYIAVFNFI